MKQKTVLTQVIAIITITFSSLSYGDEKISGTTETEVLNIGSDLVELFEDIKIEANEAHTLGFVA